MNEDILYNAWTEFLRSEKNAFPRDVSHWTPAKTVHIEKPSRTIKLPAGFPRKRVCKKEDYLSAIQRSRVRGVCTSLLGEYSRNIRRRNRLFVEIGDTTPFHIAE